MLKEYAKRAKIAIERCGCMIKFKVKVLLAVNEMTQKELAERTGIRPPTVSAICTGAIKELPVNVINKMCKELKCQPGDLMEYIPDED